MQRKVKNAKDLETGELIYFAGHAKATFMSDGRTVEDRINAIEAGGDVDLTGYATEEYVNSVAGSKQDSIEDLDAIREGASKGASALQEVPSEYITENELIWIKAEGEAGVRLKGTNGTATGNLAISAGDDKTASDGTAFTSAASGDHAVAFGFGNTCSGRTTLAQGLYNTVSGKDSVAFGQRNTVNGDQAFAAGQLNEVTTILGVAIGYKNKATNTDSIAIGYQNTSGGSASVAMGDTCEANGTSSTAMGYKTKATGDYSSTFGQNTQATNSGEVAMGLYNKSTTSTDTSEQTAFSFGIGTSDTNRTNALEIKKNGDVYLGDKKLSDFATTTDLDGKVDKVDGKQLSAEDFTSELKSKLESLNNYDDTELSNAISTLRGDFDKLVSGDTTTAIKTFNEVIAFLDGLTDTQDLESIIASIEQQIAGKADDTAVLHKAGDETITGIKTFNGRVNFLGSGDSNAMYLSTNTRLNVDGTTNTVLGFSSGTFLINNAAYNLTLRGKGTRPNYNSVTLALSSDVAAKQDTLVSGTNIKTINGTSILGSGDITIDSGTTLTEADIANMGFTKNEGTITEVKMNGVSKGTSGVVDLGTVITAHQDISGKQDTITDLATIRSGAEKGASAVQPSSLATVATSGSYNDLSNKPTIPSAVTESTVSGWGFTKNTGTYSKPSGGIPKSDLTSDVQTSLGKADTALQSHQDISGKQDKLVSGTNIKTINNTSILGSGNISITGGSGTITGVSANGTSIATSGVANIPAASTSVYGVTKLTSSTSSTSTTLAATASAVKSAYDLANSYKGTVTGVKVNGATKSPSSGTVDVGNVVTSVKINGTTYSPTSGVVDLGTISGGNSNANVQAVDTGDVVDDVTVNYATTSYVDGLIGDINSVLESIISGGGSSLIMFTIDGVSYYAEEGMTWGEWVETNYNTSGYYYNSYSNRINIGAAHISQVFGDDLIINDASYTLFDPT